MIQKNENLKTISRNENNIKKEFTLRDFNKLFLPFSILLLAVILSIASPYFFSIRNFMNLLLSVAVLGIVAVGQTFVILTGGIDLSVGSVVAVTGMFAGLLLTIPVSIPLTIIIVLGVGVLIGFLTGVSVAKAGVSPFIVTLVGLTIFRGVAIATTRGLGVNFLPDKFNFIGSGYLFKIPIPVIVMLVIFALAFFILEYTIFGRHVYAVGESKLAAFQAGLKVNKNLILVYMITGFLAAIGGIITTARLGSAQPLAAQGLELSAIAAVVLGGTSLSGGRGTIIGTLLGSVLMGLIQNGLNLLNVGMYYTQIISGIVLFIVLLFDAISNKRYRIV